MSGPPGTGVALAEADFEAEAELLEPEALAEADLEAETELLEPETEECDCVDALTVLETTVSFSTRSRGTTSGSLSGNKTCEIE